MSSLPQLSLTTVAQTLHDDDVPDQAVLRVSPTCLPDFEGLSRVASARLARWIVAVDGQLLSAPFLDELLSGSVKRLWITDLEGPENAARRAAVESLLRSRHVTRVAGPTLVPTYAFALDAFLVAEAPSEKRAA